MFSDDLKDGQEVERQVGKILLTIGYQDIKFAPDKIFKDWDIEATKDNQIKHFEDKHDRWTKRSGKVAIEIECSGKPSGLATTKADYFVFVWEKRIAICQTKELKEFLKLNWKYLEIRMLGDNKAAKNILLNKKWLFNNPQFEIYDRTN